MRFASLLLAGVLFGCSHEATSHPEPHSACLDGGTIERVGVTDEACMSLVNTEEQGGVVVDAAKAPAWTSPAADKVSAAPPPRFAWTQGTLARAGWKKWLRALDPLPEARAHGDTTGDAFLLRFQDAEGNHLHSVMTTNSEYVPSAALWDRIRAKGALRVTLIGMRFTRNALATGTKPTAAPPRPLTVE